MPVLVLSYTQKAGSVELYGYQTESTIKRHSIVGCTNGRFITYNRELISVFRAVGATTAGTAMAVQVFGRKKKKIVPCTSPLARTLVS